MPPGLLPAVALPLDALLDSELFGYGERLLGDGYFWEAHAVWEELWRVARDASPPQPTERSALRAFIQLAAAALKHATGNPAGSRKLMERAGASLARVETDEAMMLRLRSRFDELKTAAGLPS